MFMNFDLFLNYFWVNVDTDIGLSLLEDALLHVFSESTIQDFCQIYFCRVKY